MAAERPAKLACLRNPAAASDGRSAAGRLAHEAMDVFELFERFPACIALAPVPGRTRQPHSKRLGEVFVRVCLGVPVGQMADEALAVRTRRVGLRRVLRFGTAENALPVAPRRKPVGVVHGMPTFMPQEHLTPISSAAFDL